MSSVACGTGLSCSPSPITTTGTVSVNLTPTSCAAGTAEVTTASDGTSTCLPFASIPLALTVNTIPKSNGAGGLENSSVVDDGMTVTMPEKWILGGGTQFSGTTSFTVNGDTPTTTTQFAIVAADLLHSAFEEINLLIWNSVGSFTTVSHPITYWGLDVEINPIHSAGTSALTVAAIHCSASIQSPGASDTTACIQGAIGGGIIAIADGASFGGLTTTGAFAGTSESTTSAVEIDNYPLLASTSILRINATANIDLTGFVNPDNTTQRFLTVCNTSDAHYISHDVVAG